MADTLSNFSGLSSGMDYRVLVDTIMKAERRPAARLESLNDADKKRLDGLSRFETLVNALKSAADDLRSGAAFEAFSVTTLGTDAGGRNLVSAVARAGAAPGVYAVKVTSLAASQRTTAGPTGQTSATTALGYAGSFTIQRPNGGAALGVVTVDPADTLNAIRDKINALNTGATPSRVQATIVAGGQDGNDQRLVLSSLNPGEAGGFELVPTSGTALEALGLDPANATLAARPAVVAATDATLEVNGVPVRRATNTVADAIPGVTLTLAAADLTRSATVTVERMDSAVVNDAKRFVDAYNAVVDFATKEGGSAATGVLKGDPMLRGIRGLLTSTLLGSAAAGADDMRTLSAVGMSVDKTGKLALDEAKYKDAVGTRIEDVRAMFADRAGAFKALATSYTDSVTGLVGERRRGIDQQTLTRSRRIDDIDARLDVRKSALLRQYAKFEASLGRIKAIGDQMGAQFSALTRGRDG